MPFIPGDPWRVEPDKEPAASRTAASKKESVMIRTSVIIPVYNTEDYLEECLDSVLAQTQKEIEIILVDDGSTDRSLEIIRSYTERYPFIRLIQQEHQFQGTARNRGLKEARGKYVYFMDSDDAVMPELFETCYALAEEKVLDYVLFDAHEFSDESDELVDGFYDRTYLSLEERIYTGPEFWNMNFNRGGMLFVCWLLYIRRDYLLENDLFYEERTYYEDNDWTLRMYLNAERIYYLHRKLYRYRRRTGSNMLSGFTPDLLKGCFRMHKVLVKLIKVYEEPDRKRMIYDLINLNANRFDWLKDLTDISGHTGPLTDFCRYLEEEVSKETDEELARIHMLAARHIAAATKNWPDRAWQETGAGTLTSAMNRMYGLYDPAKKVAIYGHGVKCGRFLDDCKEGFGTPTSQLVFVETSGGGGTYRGFPIINVRELKAFDADMILISSQKYAEAMLQEIERHCPGSRARIAQIV